MTAMRHLAYHSPILYTAIQSAKWSMMAGQRPFALQILNFCVREHVEPSREAAHIPA
jgi:hypothetical protein